jgi:hypothetical protein
MHKNSKSQPIRLELFLIVNRVCDSKNGINLISPRQYSVVSEKLAT